MVTAIIFNIIWLIILLTAGGMTGDGYCVFIAFIVYLIFILPISFQIYDAIRKVKDAEERKKMIHQQKKQEKYDNDWGIIDFSEKKRK